MEKKAIRSRLKEIRKELSPALREQKSSLILQKLVAWEGYQKASCVLCYASYGTEVNTEQILKQVLADGKRLYLPRVEGNEMTFYRIQELSDLQEGYRGIREPLAAPEGRFFIRDEKQVTECLLLAPGLGFTLQGQRIGYGGGYYDRFLANYPNLLAMGLCFEEQICSSLPLEDTDKPLHGFITDHRLVEHIG